MNAQVLDHETGQVTVYSQQALVADANDMAVVGAVASQVAANHVFHDYLSRKAQNTVQAHLCDLGTFCAYLQWVEEETKKSFGLTPVLLQSTPTAWGGITWGMVDGFVKWLLGKGYAVGTINRSLSTVKVYVGLAHQSGVIGDGDYLRVKNVKGYKGSEAKHVNEKRGATRVGHKKAQPVHITDDQAELLKRQPDTPQGRRDQVMMCLLLDHGLRAGELSGLKVGDIDLGSGMVRFDRPKVGKSQNHKLSADTLRALRAYIDAGDCPTEGYLLRGSRKGGKLDGNGMNEIAITVRVKELAERIGVVGMSAHDCRHYWATKWAGRVDVFRLQEAGGWSSLEMPRRYIARAAVANEGMV